MSDFRDMVPVSRRGLEDAECLRSPSDQCPYRSIEIFEREAVRSARHGGLLMNWRRNAGFLVVILFFVSLAGTSWGLPFSDVKKDVNQLFDRGDSFTWVFDLDNDNLAPGDISDKDFVLPPVILSILFKDDDRDFSRRGLGQLEFAVVKADQGWWRIAEVDNGPEEWFFNLWPLVVKDHKLSVTIKSLWGDFEVQSLTLSGDYTKRIPAASVPETATSIMLGMGLLALAGLSGKRLVRKP
jgi:hypothetical protein